MCDIEKILKNFEDDLNSKSQKEKITYLRSFGFQVCEKKPKNNATIKKQNKDKSLVIKA